MAQSLAPLSARLDYEAILLVWLAINILLLFGAIVLVSHYSHNHPLLPWLLPIFFTPVMKSFWVGQVSCVMLALFTAAWVAIKQERRACGGAILALAAWIKVYPVLMLLYFLLRRDWRVIRGAVIAGLIIGLVQILISGFDTLWQYLTEILPNLTAFGQDAGMFKNSSILGFAYRLFTETNAIALLVHQPALVPLARLVLTSLLIIPTGHVLLKPPRLAEISEDERFDLEYAVVMLLSLLLTSILWVSGMSVLLLPYYLLLRHPLTPRLRIMVWLSFAIVSIYFPYLLAYQPGNRLSVWVLSISFYGIVILWGVVIYRLNFLKATEST